jgi:hypothetical protein
MDKKQEVKILNDEWEKYGLPTHILEFFSEELTRDMKKRDEEKKQKAKDEK